MNLFNRKSMVFLLIVSFYFTIALVSCFKDKDSKDAVVSSRAYSGHESDMDANNFVGA